jgi:hypothetical protein
MAALVRKILFWVLLINVLLILYGLVRYASLGQYPWQYTDFSVVNIIILLVVGFFIFRFLPKTSKQLSFLQISSLNLSVILVVIWTAVIFITHLVVPNSLKGVGGIGTYIFILAIVLSALTILYISFTTARKDKKIISGIQVGLYSGFIVGVVTYLIILSMILIFMNYLLQYPKEMHDFLQTRDKDIHAWFFFEELSGSLGFLITDIVMGIILGTVGGFIGKLSTNKN